MRKTILIIDGHPDPQRERFVHALADAYAAGATAAGHIVERIDVATLDFPVLRSKAEWMETSPADSVRQTQAAILRANHIVFVFPLWLGDMPALLKALLEQVARPGFAFSSEGDPKPLLGGRSARLIVTMGMPGLIYRFYYGAHSVKSFTRSILKFVGIAPVHHILVGSVERDPQRRVKWLCQMASLGRTAA